MADLEKLVDDLSNLTVMEAAELSKMLEEKWGVSAAAPVPLLLLPVVLPVVMPLLKRRRIRRHPG
jgi:ribosomal protein L7/L12